MPDTRSWDHRIELLTEEELAELRERDAVMQRNHPDLYAAGYGVVTCSRRCPQPVAFRISYRYVTGRAGRVTTADKRVCAKHAETFRQRAMAEGKE